jgi:hypothetical protein
MSKPIPPKCRSCAANLSGAEARERTCWVNSVCVRRRDNLRYRAKAKRRSLAQSSNPEVTLLEAYYFVRRLWQNDRRHAIGLELWCGSRLVEAVVPQHVLGVSKRQVEAWEMEAIGVMIGRHEAAAGAVVRQQYVHPEEKCPIEHCPRHGIGGRGDANHPV